MEGLARLLVLEKLTDTDIRYAFLESRRTLRGRPNPLGRYNRWRKKLKGDLKANETIAGLEANDYDVATLHIPYGPGWDARRIDKLVYQTVSLRFVLFIYPMVTYGFQDLGMNCTMNFSRYPSASLTCIQLPSIPRIRDDVCIGIRHFLAQSKNASTIVVRCDNSLC